MDENRNRNQRFKLQISDNPIIFPAQPVKRIRCFIRRKRNKTRLRMPVRVSRTDIVLHCLRPARHRIVHVAVEHFMKLKDIALRNRNRVKTLVNNSQHIPVARNFLLVSVLRLGFFFHKLPDARIRGNDAFDGIGRLCTLHLGDLYQLFKCLRSLLQIHLLLSCFFVYGCNQPQQFGIPHFIPD